MSNPQPSTPSAGVPANPGAIADPVHAGSARRAGQGRGIRIAAAVAILAGAAALAVYEFRSPPKAEPIAVGGLAPDFSLHDAQKDDRDAPVSLSQMVQKGPVVIVFNMGLHCAACAQDLAEYSARFDDFRHAGIQVVAVSHETTAETRVDLDSWSAIPFPLLSDPDEKVARSFGLAAPDGTMNERTFLVDRNRHILCIEAPDRPGGAIAHLLDLATPSKNPR